MSSNGFIHQRICQNKMVIGLNRKPAQRPAISTLMSGLTRVKPDIHFRCVWLDHGQARHKAQVPPARRGQAEGTSNRDSNWGRKLPSYGRRSSSLSGPFSAVLSPPSVNKPSFSAIFKNRERDSPMRLGTTSQEVRKSAKSEGRCSHLEAQDSRVQKDGKGGLF